MYKIVKNSRKKYMLLWEPYMPFLETGLEAHWHLLAIEHERKLDYLLIDLCMHLFTHNNNHQVKIAFDINSNLHFVVVFVLLVSSKAGALFLARSAFVRTGTKSVGKLIKSEEAIGRIRKIASP